MCFCVAISVWKAFTKIKVFYIKFNSSSSSLVHLHTTLINHSIKLKSCKKRKIKPNSNKNKNNQFNPSNTQYHWVEIVLWILNLIEIMFQADCVQKFIDIICSHKRFPCPFLKSKYIKNNKKRKWKSSHIQFHSIKWRC